MKIEIERDTVQQALDALRCCYGYSEAATGQRSSAITNLSKALAAPQPAEQAPDKDCDYCGGTGEADSGGIHPWGAQASIRCRCTYPQNENEDTANETNAVIAPSVQEVMQQALEYAHATNRYESTRQDLAIAALREALSTAKTPESGGIKPDDQPVGWIDAGALKYLASEEMNWISMWNREVGPKPIAVYAAQPAQQQESNALHLAAMDLASNWALRIAELETEVARFRADVMTEKSARQALEQQLADRVPLTDDEIRKLWKFPYDMSWMDAVIATCRAIESAHGIK